MSERLRFVVGLAILAVGAALFAVASGGPGAGLPGVLQRTQVVEALVIAAPSTGIPSVLYFSHRDARIDHHRQLT